MRVCFRHALLCDTVQSGADVSRWRVGDKTIKQLIQKHLKQKRRREVRVREYLIQ